MISDLGPDVRIILLARGLRSFAFSNLNVVFAIYLSNIGYSTLTIGAVHSVAYISGAVLSALWGFSSDRLGRKRILISLSVLTIISTSIYIFSTHLAMILLAVILVNVGAGGTAGGGQGGGPFNPVEQAFLAEKCKAEERNRIFGIMAFIGSVLGSLGALVSGVPQYLQEARGWGAIASYKPLFALTVLFCIAFIFLYRRLQEEPRPRETRRFISKKSGIFVTKMSLLGIVDNLGAGMLSPLISYWFYLRFGVELKALGLLFFLSYLLAAISFLLAPLIARRIGVVRTMAFSHAAASVLYLILPFAPTFYLAGVILVARSFLAYMDNPLRESYTMAMVKSQERGSAAGMTNLARVVPFGVSPTISAYMMQSLSLTIPLVIGAALQLTHDITFYYLFRHERPPEEARIQEIKVEGAGG
ncbi:MAG: MFS transporter [Deltaproteobacteria bacterium]|nr:MFS transporter [Deltaproteobacteria bacterium]